MLQKINGGPVLSNFADRYWKNCASVVLSTNCEKWKNFRCSENPPKNIRKLHRTIATRSLIYATFRWKNIAIVAEKKLLRTSCASLSICTTRTNMASQPTWVIQLYVLLWVFHHKYSSLKWQIDLWQVWDLFVWKMKIGSYIFQTRSIHPLINCSLKPSTEVILDLY